LLRADETTSMRLIRESKKQSANRPGCCEQQAFEKQLTTMRQRVAPSARRM